MRSGLRDAWVLVLAWMLGGASMSDAGIAEAPVGPSGATAEGMSLENRRYLLYLYARLGRPGPAEVLAKRILAENPRDQQTLLVLASMYVELRDAGKAMATARRLVREYPGDDQSQYFLAASHHLAGHYDAARDVFARLRDVQFRGQKTYPYLGDLAAASLKSGDWPQAIHFYQELLRTSGLKEPARLEVRRVLEGLYYEHLPRMEAMGHATVIRGGSLQRTEESAWIHWSERGMAQAHFAATGVDVKQAPGVRAHSASYFEGLAGLGYELRQGWELGALIGGHDSGAIGGGWLRRRISDRASFRFDAVIGEAARDGLLIESVNGRQDKLSLRLEGALPLGWSGAVRVQGRRVGVEGHELGTGFGTQASLERTLIKDVPGWSVGWRSVWSQFHRSRLESVPVDVLVPVGGGDEARRRVLTGMILSDYHREGVFTTARGQWSGALFWQGTMGVDWSFEQSSPETYVTWELRYFIRKSLELRTEVGYSTSAGGADQGSDQWSMDFGLKYWF